MSKSTPTRAVTAGAIFILGLVTACSDGNDAGSDTTAGPASAWPQSDVTVGPLVSGSHSSIGGTAAWTDYVYDDRGPNTDSGDRTDIASAGGDGDYPGGLSNAADFVQVQISDSDEGIRIRVVLQTFIDPAVPLVGIAFDTDQDAATGAPRLPGSWEPDGALGVELLLVMSQGAGEVLKWAEGQWQNLAGLDVRVDTNTNTMDTVLPSDLETPGKSAWNVIGVAGTNSDSWLTGSGKIHDLAFVGDEPPYQWQDYRQADILAGKAPVDAAIARVDFGSLASQSTILPESTAAGFHTYLYHSDLALAEGIAATPDGPEFLGPYQPYLVYIPVDGFSEGEAMTMFLHGLTQNHLGSVLVGDTYLGTGRALSEEIGSLEQYVRDGTDFPPHNLTVWPLARGAGLFYEGIAEQDVLDVLDDTMLRLRPDPDRIILSGASMGGIGTFRLGALYPDLWSVAVPIIGYARPGAEPLLTNFENLEILQINGAVDTLIPKELAESTTDLLDGLGVRFQAWMLDQRGHEAGGYAYDCVYRDLPGYVREANPARIHYTVDPANFVVDPESGLELIHKRAYWVSGIMLADQSAPGTVEARSLALDQRSVENVIRTDERYEGGDGGRDLCGPNPDISTGDTWRYRALMRDFGPELPKQQQLETTLTNLAGVTLDLARAGLDGGVEAVVRITTDNGAEIVLNGLEAGQAVAVTGVTFTVGAAGTVRVPVPVGTTTIDIIAN